MVASRWAQRLPFLAAAISRSTSRPVRYSRVRTEEFTVVGADRPPLRFFTIFCPRFDTTGELSTLSSLVSIGVVGIHGWPTPASWTPPPSGLLPPANTFANLPAARRHDKAGSR